MCTPHHPFSSPLPRVEFQPLIVLLQVGANFLWIAVRPPIVGLDAKAAFGLSMVLIASSGVSLPKGESIRQSKY